ncbi:Os08g0198550 [Oryza sativa Japonica Group]|uniref:Os08g0198550 protein n=2 Tax=Oryza TaxID=4527 RepID=A0A0P0XD94_ORYSJ|nr:Os08g0198550 [Oryza sativa Japonica Group]
MVGARRRWVKGEVRSGRRPSERREKSGGQQGWRLATEARGRPHAAVGPSRSSREFEVEEDDDATTASRSSASSTRSGSKAEAEQSGCYGSEEAGSAAPLPIRSIFLHIAAAIRCRVLVRRLQKRRRGVARQLVLRGQESGLRWRISARLVGFAGRRMRLGGGRGGTGVAWRVCMAS